MQIDINTLI